MAERTAELMVGRKVFRLAELMAERTAELKVEMMVGRKVVRLAKRWGQRWGFVKVQLQGDRKVQNIPKEDEKSSFSASKLIKLSIL